MMETLQQEAFLVAEPAAVLRRFPYAFAKRYGVLLDRVEAGRGHVFHRPGLKLAALAETRRLLGLPLVCEEVSPEVFGNLLRAPTRAIPANPCRWWRASARTWISPASPTSCRRPRT